jgi:hypothetical protein
MGLELGKVMRAQRDWEPRRIDPANRAVTPTQMTGPLQSRHTLTNARNSTMFSFLRAMLLDQPRELFSAKGREAIRCFRDLKKRLGPMAPPALAGYRNGYLELIDPLVRDRIGAIYKEHFAPEPESEYAGQLARTRKLSSWICELPNSNIS